MTIKKSILITVTALAVLGIANIDKGIVKNNNHIEIGKEGYYTEASLLSPGESVYIIGDIMVSSKGLTYLK